MFKLYCDRCGKQLDNKNMKYVSMTIRDYEDDENYETWEFCHDCSLSIKRIILKNIAECEDKNKND